MQFRDDRSAHEIKGKGAGTKARATCCTIKAATVPANLKENGPPQKASPQDEENPTAQKTLRAHPNKPKVAETNSGSVEAAGYYEGVVEAGNHDEGGDEVGKVVD
jgi:hypothetical protein